MASSTARGVAMRLDGDERRAANLVRADHPAGKLGGERGLALAALAAHHRVTLVAQQPLECEQLAAAADEARSFGSGGSVAEAVSQRGLQVGLGLRRGVARKSCGSSFSWKSTGTNQSCSLSSPAPKMRPRNRVVLQLALAFEHGVAHALAAGERGIEGLRRTAAPSRRARCGSWPPPRPRRPSAIRRRRIPTLSRPSRSGRLRERPAGCGARGAAGRDRW